MIRQQRRPIENVAEKMDFPLFHFLSRFSKGPSCLKDWREFGLELKRRDCARVLTEVVEFIALPFPFPSKLRPRPHVSVFVWERRYFPSVFKKRRVHTKCIRIVFACPYENAKQWKYESIPHRVCVIIVVNDVLHHGIRKPTFSSVHTYTWKQRFRKVPFSSIVFIRYVWTEAVSVKKKLAFSTQNGYVWTGP